MTSPWSMLLLLPLLAGCQGVLTYNQEDISEKERKKLLGRARAPAEIGLQVIESDKGTSIRWREMVRPENAVTVPLMPQDSAASVQPAIAVSINGGRPVRMAIDTGAPVNLVDTGIALDTKLDVADPEKVRNVFRGLRGEEETFFGMAQRVGVGKDLSFRNVLFAIRSARFERKLAGLVVWDTWKGNLLGMSSLERFAYFSLDYPRSVAVFSHRDFFSEPASPVVAKVPFRYEERQIRVPVSFGNSRQYDAVLDTGNDTSMMISTNLVKQMGWQKLMDAGRRERYVGLGGDMELCSFVIPSMKLGNVSFENVTVTVGPDEFRLMIGSHFLHKYKVTVDFRRKNLWLERAE